MSAVRRVLVTLFLSLAVYGCSPKASDVIVLQVGPSKVSLREYENFYTRNSSGWDAAQKSTMEEREHFLDLLTDYKLKLLDAYDKNLINDTDIVRELRDYRTSLASTYILDRELTEPGVKLVYQRRLEYLRPQHILLSLKPDASPEETLKTYTKAMEIIRRAKAGEDFDSLAMKYSDDPSTKSNHGDLYFVTTGTLVKPFEDAMYGLQKGQITDVPVRTTFGYHIIKMLDREPTRLLKARHIMVRFQKANPDSADTAAAFVRITAALDSLNKGWDFAKLAMKVSEDPGSAPQGGDLGWFERRRWVLPFDESVFTLHAGQTTGIVRTPFGYHIIRCDSEKSLPPFSDPQFKEEMKKLYQQHRYSDDFADYVARMKKEFHYSFNEDAFSSMLSYLDSTQLVGDSAWDEKVPAEVRALTMMTMDGRTITVDTVLAALDGRPEFRNTALRRGDLRPRVDRIAESLLLEAQAAGLEVKYPEFSSLMKEYDDGVVLYKAEQLEVWNKNTVSDSALKAYYEENKSKYMYPEKVNIGEIYADTDTLGAKLYDSLLHGSDFGELAARHAQDAELQEKKGERGLLPIDTDDLTKLGAKLNVGEFSTPTPLDDGGFVIVKLIAREPAAQKTYEQAAAEISNTFQDIQSKQLERQWIDRIRQRYPVIQYKERLADAFKDTP